MLQKKCNHVKTPVKTAGTQINLSEIVSDNSVQFCCCADKLLHQLSGWLVSDDLSGEEAGCGGAWMVWLYLICSSQGG